MDTSTLAAGQERLVERIGDWKSGELLVDKQAGTVRNIALAGLSSKNGYRYAESALRQAVGLYADKPVFLDHGPNLVQPKDRSTRDLVGKIARARFHNGRLRGDIETVDTEAGRTFLALAESDAPALGMSHVVLATRNSGGTIVEQIHEVVSVDAVMFPATTISLRENQHSPVATLPLGSLESIAQQIDQQLQRHVRRITGNENTECRRVALFPEQVVIEVHKTGESESQKHTISWHLNHGRVHLSDNLETVNEQDLSESASGQFANNSDEQLKQLTAENVRLRADIAVLKSVCDSAETAVEIERLIESARLPAYAVSPALKQQLTSATDRAARESILRDRIALVDVADRRAPYSSERHQAVNTTADDAFVRTIRGERFSVLNGIG